MKIGFVVNDLETEAANYTTTRLAMKALELGHDAWYVGVADFGYDQDEAIIACAHAAPGRKYASGKSYLAAVRGAKAAVERTSLTELDVVMLRSDPADDGIERPWAAQAGVMFCRRAMEEGLVVVNHPDGLLGALNKMYFQDFPEAVRPRTIITRDPADIKAFAKSEGGRIVLKPLQGSGGQSVFLIRPEDASNLNQIIDAVSRDGYIVAQEYLPAAEKGDTRMFLMNGVPLEHKGRYAAFRRERSGDDMRSNVTAGGTVGPAKIDDVALGIADMVRPKLVKDGMFFVGLDIVGDKLMEINVFSPGGLGCSEEFEDTDFTRLVIESLERKVRYAGQDHRATHSRIISTL